MLGKLKINPSVKGLSESATLKINEKCAELKKQGKTVYNLGLGQSPFPVPDEIVFALIYNAEKKAYLSCRGLDILRKQVATFYKVQHDLAVGADQVLIGTGSKIMLFMLQLVLDANVILPSPCWVSYAPQAKMFGRRASIIETKYENNWKITPQELEAACVNRKINLLILNSPSNPTGQMHSAEELKALAEVAKRNDLIIVSDEIYSLMSYGEQHDSIYRYYPEGTIISSGMSKWCGAGGWRLGTFVFPKELREVQDAMIKVTSESVSSTAAPIQYAAITAFSSQIGKQYLEGVNKVLEILSITCAKMLMSAGIKTLYPQGGFYLFINFEKFADKLADKGIDTSALLCERLLEDTGVAVLPGSDCLRPTDELSARVALVNFDGAKALQSAKEIEGPLNSEFAQRFCRETYDAIDKVCHWAEHL